MVDVPVKFVPVEIEEDKIEQGAINVLREIRSNWDINNVHFRAGAGEMTDVDVSVHRLWVTVSCFGEGNLFAVYPRLLAAMLEERKTDTVGPPNFDILLPSNEEWRTKIYYQLVQKQRLLKGMPQAAAFLDRPRSAGPWDTTIPPAKRPRTCTVTTALATRGFCTGSRTPVAWTVGDLVKAAALLKDPPENVNFVDEQEMRRVYSVVYDVFRYKNVLNQALSDIQFFYLFPELRDSTHLVWLLLYDLYHRKFSEREHMDGSAAVADNMFPTAGLSAPEAALWATRVRIAAAMSRLRIANSALKLSDMLPAHLRDEKVVSAVMMAPVMCWVNKNKICPGKTPQTIFEEIRVKLGLHAMESDTAAITDLDMRWDPLCPLFLSFHHTQRTNIAQSSYVKNHVLILQNRSFCYGPATFCKLLLMHNLTGSVIQTHVSSPRATAYFATLLGENKQIHALLVFGAGNRKQEYENYFSSLGVKNIFLYSQNLFEMDPTTQILENVCAVFVTPPNSYSAVCDPIDLVCSRGGDLQMLEILTDTSDSSESRKRVSKVLEDQRLSLRYSMSRPQFQFVLYETHSQLSAENGDMVKQVLLEVNRAAQYKHLELSGKISLLSNAPKLEIMEINNNEMDKVLSTTTTDEEIEVGDKEEEIVEIKTKEEILDSVEIPAIDYFELQTLPDLCFNADACLCLEDEGCYLALCQRKEVTRFDAKYMIKMAETRGLFGSNTDQSKNKQKTAKARKKESASTSGTPIKRKRGKFEIERISAQTHASMMRSHVHCYENGDISMRCCPRHSICDTSPKMSPARLWWAETAKYLTRLRKSLLKQKLVSNKPTILKIITNEKINKDISNIDEILKLCTKKDIPPFPRLRLTRPNYTIERVPYPVRIRSVKLDTYDLFDEDDEEELSV